MLCGEPFALVVAETRAAAQDAAELIVVEVEQLPSVSDIRNAQDAAAPQLHGEAPANLALDWGYGDEQAVAEIFTAAAHVTRLELTSNRVVINPVEPRAAVAEFADGTSRTACW